MMLALALLLPGTLLAAGSAPVCPGPAGPGSARCHAHVVTDGRGQPNATTSPTGYGPAQFHGAYQLPATTATVQTIAIVDAFDDPNIESDLAVYNSTFGLPPCTTANGCFLKVNQNGSASGPFPRTNSGWALEISLDVEIAHAICQNCKIILVEADSNSFANLSAAVDMAARLGANVISDFFFNDKSSTETASDVHYNHPGAAITASSGDNGFGVEYPAASQFVTAVGGTTLRVDANNNRLSETVWSGAGSGCSAFEPKPAWQTDAGCARRTVADVSADSDPNTGAAVYDTVRLQGQQGWFQVGGTSLAAPLIAAVYALAGNGSAVTYGSFPYAHTNFLFDVVSGSNGTCGTYLCNGGTGYDGPSGLGTPNGTGGF